MSKQEAKAFEALIKRYHPIIYKICRVYADADDFDDLYQEVLITLWKSQHSFEERSKISTWLYRVVLNTALTYQRNTKKHKTRVPLSEVQLPPADSEVAQEKEKRVAQLYAAISQLKKDDRSIILLYLDENSYEDIAAITGLTISNVGVKINRVKKRLLKILKEQDHE